jgi:hypothetical protein
MAPPQISRKALGLLLLLAAAAVAVSPAAADDVVALTEADFEKEVGQDRAALVEFYAPWFVNSFLSLSFTHTPLLVTALDLFFFAGITALDPDLINPSKSGIELTSLGSA